MLGRDGHRADRNDGQEVTRRRGHKQRDTHFLCFPLVNDTSVPQLTKSLAYFRRITSRRKDDDDSLVMVEHDTSVEPHAHKLKIIPEEAFRPPGTYHLTLGVMDLSRQVQMDKALALLRSIDITMLLQEPAASNTQRLELSQTRPESNHSNPPLAKTFMPLNISLTGLSTFPSAKSARVLYAKPQDSTSRLHDFAVAIRQKFREAGLITETRPLVLHATVGNLRYAVQGPGQKSNGGNGGWQPERERRRDDGQIDAREIVKVFDEQNGQLDEDRSQSEVNSLEKHEFLWADNIMIGNLAICKLGAMKSEDPVLELEYPPIATRSLYAEETDLNT